MTGSGGKSFWERGDFPTTATNGTSGIEVVVQDIWSNGTNAAPFDQSEFRRLVSYMLSPLQFDFLRMSSHAACANPAFPSRFPLDSILPWLASPLHFIPPYLHHRSTSLFLPSNSGRTLADNSSPPPPHLDFYLVLDLAVGGTTGWFPDATGDKPWYDSSITAMTDFAEQQSTWSATWSDDDDSRAFRIASVDMWSLC